MKIRLLIASSDEDYLEHLSRVLTEEYESTFEVTVCTAVKRLAELESNKKFDVALLGPEFVEAVPDVRLCLLLWSGESDITTGGGMSRVRKYQRISNITSKILEEYAEVSPNGAGESDAKVSVVWAPAGGCGKTTVSLACAAQQVSKGKKVIYLDLEPFSSIPAYFSNEGKSISTVFAKLDSNVSLLMQSIRQEDSGSGIGYFGGPDNYDDIAVLTGEDAVCLVNGCAAIADEIVVDLGADWDERTAALLERADTVFAVIDGSRSCQIKWRQFCEQHNIFERLRDKLILVVNRGAQSSSVREVSTVRLPLVQSDDPIVVYKTLSAGYFAL